LKITKEKVLVDEIVAVEQALMAIKSALKPRHYKKGIEKNT